LKENFDRFNFVIHKEKEMVDFRRWITAIAVLALFAGLASAQVNSSSAAAGLLSCNATVAVPPQLRAEGMTELIGDIVLTCQGGNPLAVGSTIPTANITVSLLTTVTSRLLSGNVSEALLLIDEPGAGPSTALGPGPVLGQTLCSSTSVGAGPGGCVMTVAANGQSQLSGGGAAPNVFQGTVSSNQVIFNGIPINPPVTAGTARVFRITNIRANASAIGSGGFAGTSQLLASISISGSTSLPINNPVQIAGFIQAGLSTSVRKGASGDTGFSALAFGQCADATRAPVALLRYAENFGTAFKTRVAPTASYNGQNGSGTVQNIPGSIYNSESGFVSSITGAAGLADYGTRLKAVFNNVPSGVRLFVSTTNVPNTGTATTAAPPATSTSSFAQLVLSETAVDSFNSAPVVASTTSVNSGTTFLAEIPVVNGSATAVWEVINTNPSQSEVLAFGVWTSFTSASNSPLAGTATVNMSYAPTPGTGSGFTATSGAVASSSLTIPRFVDTSSGTNILTVTICNTVLLYPFVTNQGGFDTGIAIANTTTDPFGTRAQAGACTLNFYGASAPPANTTAIGTVATGTVGVTLASIAAPGFQGYMIATCSFQLAHGFAFISDLGARNIAMGYLALVVPTGTGDRNSGDLTGAIGTTSVEGAGH
jgi:hypothetical protein